jgi:hypothetical protein
VPADELDSGNAELRAKLGDDVTAFGTLCDDYFLAFRTRPDGTHEVGVVDLYRLEYAPSLSVIAPSFEEWAVLEVFGQWEHGVRTVDEAMRVIDAATDDNTLDPELGRLFAQVVMHWQWDESGRFLRCDEHVISWWPARPSPDQIDPTFVQYWGATEYTPSIPKEWRLCCPFRCETAGMVRLQTAQRAALAAVSAGTIYGVLDSRRFLVAFDGSPAFGVLKWDDRTLERFPSFAAFVRHWTRSAVQSVVPGLREVRRLLEAAIDKGPG